MAVTLPRPGSTPKMMPITRPSEMNITFCSVRAASKPAIKLSSIGGSVSLVL